MADDLSRDEEESDGGAIGSEMDDSYGDMMMGEEGEDAELGGDLSRAQIQEL